MPRKPRVLHIIKTLGLGGAETNLLNLVGAFDAEKVESHVAYSFGGEIEPRFREAGARLYKYADNSHKVKSPYSLLIVLRLARYIRRHRIDIVHTHNFNAHIWGLLAAKLGGAKVVEHVHDSRYVAPEELVRRHGWMSHYRFIKYFRNQSDRVVVLTDDNRRYLIEHRLSAAERIVEIPNGIPMDDYVPKGPTLRTDMGIADDAVVILTGARMEKGKNIPLILRAAKAVVAVTPKTVFLIAGTGTLLDEYRALANRMDLDAHVRFIGFRQDMYALLAIADVFLLPSFLELHSIAILEAQKMRVPVVVSSGVGCNDEFIRHGVDGFLCDPFIDAPWIATLTRLVNDPVLRRTVGANGYAVCRRLFDLPVTARRFEALYGELTTRSEMAIQK
ncbi:MAG: glycosyltransferase family 4 protein [Burkholderiaceae bacterium]